MCVQRVIHFGFVCFFLSFPFLALQRIFMCFRSFLTFPSMCVLGFFSPCIFISKSLWVAFFSSYSLCKTIYKIYNRYAMCAFKISSLALVGFGFLSLESSKIIGNAHVVVTNFVGSAIISDGFFSSVAQTTLPSKWSETNVRLNRGWNEFLDIAFLFLHAKQTYI